MYYSSWGMVGETLASGCWTVISSTSEVSSEDEPQGVKTEDGSFMEECSVWATHEASSSKSTWLEPSGIMTHWDPAKLHAKLNQDSNSSWEEKMFPIKVPASPVMCKSMSALESTQIFSSWQQHMDLRRAERVHICNTQGGSRIEKKDLGLIFFFPWLWVD